MEDKNKLHPDTRLRLNVDITKKQADALSKVIPWGYKKEVFSVIVDDLIEFLSNTEYREKFIMLILSKKTDALSFSKSANVVKKGSVK